MFKCICDRYDNGLGAEYEDVEDFQAMCEGVFGVRAELHASGTDWVDETGRIVLVPA